MKPPKVAPKNHAHAAHNTHAHAAKSQAAHKQKAPARTPTHSAEQAAAAMQHVVRQLAGAGRESHVAHVAIARTSTRKTTAAVIHAPLRTELQRNRTSAHLGGPSEVASASQRRAVTVTRTRERIVVDTRGGDDQIRIYRDRRTGGLVVRVNDDRRLAFDRREASRLTIRAGDGNDRIFVGTGVHINLTLEGGAGNDRIIGGAGNERIRGGAGSDYLNGSRGRDTLVGNSGDDVIYAGHGNDRVRGGRGNDYLEGGTGRDSIRGDRGRDILSGGRGNDSLSGASGTDRLYAGAGRDRLYDASGRDRIFAQESADRIHAGGRRHQHVVNVELAGVPGGSIRIDGVGRFRERVQADLDFLRSSRTGQDMLRALQRGAERGNTITIDEAAREYVTSGANDPSYRNTRTGRPGRGEDATIWFAPSDLSSISNESWGKAPPVVWLYHEMVHGYNSVSGTSQRGLYRGPGVDGDHRVRNDERQAVGLGVDHDNNDETPLRKLNPPRLTENGLRFEMGLPKRRSYA